MGETWVRSLGQEVSTGEGNGSPLQYYCLENPMNRGAWQATNYGITRVDTTERLSAHTQRDMYTTYIDINLLNLGINTKGHISNLLKYVFCVHTEISTHIYRER